MNNDHTELIIQVRRDLSRFSYPTSWSNQIDDLLQPDDQPSDKVLQVFVQLVLETSKNEYPTASPGNLVHCLITLIVNFFFPFKSSQNISSQ